MRAIFATAGGRVTWPNLKGFRIVGCLCGLTLEQNFRVELYADDQRGVPLTDGAVPALGTAGTLVLRNDHGGTEVNYAFNGITLVNGQSVAAPGLHGALLGFQFPPLAINQTNAGASGPLVSAENQATIPDTDYHPADAAHRLWGAFTEAPAVEAVATGAAAKNEAPPLGTLRGDKPLQAASHEATGGAAVLTLTAKRNAENSWLNLLLRANATATQNFTLTINATSFAVTPAVAPLVCYEELFGRFKGLAVPTATQVIKDAKAGAAGGTISRDWIETELSEILAYLQSANGLDHPDAQPTQRDPQVVERLTVPFLAGPAVNLFAGF